MLLPAAVRTNRSGVIRSTEEALAFIARELPAELRSLPRWTFARDLLRVAEQTQKRRDLTTAYRQLRQALGNDHLLDEAESE